MSIIVNNLYLIINISVIINFVKTSVVDNDNNSNILYDK